MIHLKKNREKVQNQCKKIALLGTKNGVGVTHIGILLAEFLSETMGARVAFLEINYYGHIEKIERELWGYSKDVFSYAGVDFYKEIETVKIENLQECYQYLILDFGIQKKKDEQEIQKCDEKVIIGTLNLWEWQEYMQAVTHFRKLWAKENISYVVTFGNEKLIHRMKKVLKEKVWFLGYQPMETVLSAKIESFFNTLI